MRRLLPSPCCSLSVLCHGALAEEGDTLTGTLKTIHDRGTILIGYRNTALPFSFLNKAGQPIGFSIDICHGIAEDVATAAAPGPAGSRCTGLADGGAHRLRAGDGGRAAAEGHLGRDRSRVRLDDRQRRTGEDGGVLAGVLPERHQADGAAGNGRPAVASYRDLAGRTVVVGTGTTNAEAMRRLADKVPPPIKVVEAPDLDAAYDMLVAGKADAFASDDILLAGYIATRPGGANFAHRGRLPVVRTVRDHAAPRRPRLRRPGEGLVRAHGERGDARPVYDRWLVDRLPTGETLRVPMSPYLTEMYRALGQPD